MKGGGGETYTDICPAINEVGSYNFKVKLKPAYDLESEGEVRDFTAKIAKFDLTDKNIEVIYGKQSPVDGEEHEVVISQITVDNVVLADGDYEIVSGKSARTITPQSIVIQGKNSFEGKSAPSAKKWTLQKPEPAIDDFDVPVLNNATYSGNAVKIPAPTAKQKGIGEITVKYNGSANAPVDAGEYKVTFDVDEGELFCEAEGLEIGTLVIHKASYDGEKTADDRFAMGYNDTSSTVLPSLPDGAEYIEEEISTGGESPKILQDIRLDYYSSIGHYICYLINAGSKTTSATVTIPVRNAKNYKDYEVVVTIHVYDPDCNHVWDEGKVLFEPTCDASGKIEYICTICGGNKFEFIEPSDHEYERTETPVTCTEDGSVVYVCKNCEYSYSETIPATGHNYIPIVTKKPTTDEPGIMTYTCDRCSDTYTESIEKLPGSPTTLTLKKTSDKVYLKGTVKISATVKNGVGSTTFKSANSKIAKVSSKGVVTGVKAGKTVITVSNNGVSKQFTITVKKPVLNKKTVTLKVKKSFTLKITGKVGKAAFTSSNKKIATVSSKGKILAKKKGKATITVKTNGIKLTCKVNVK